MLQYQQEDIQFYQEFYVMKDIQKVFLFLYMFVLQVSVQLRNLVIPDLRYFTFVSRRSYPIRLI